MRSVSPHSTTGLDCRCLISQPATYTCMPTACSGPRTAHKSWFFTIFSFDFTSLRLRAPGNQARRDDMPVDPVSWLPLPIEPELRSRVRTILDEVAASLSRAINSEVRPYALAELALFFAYL